MKKYLQVGFSCLLVLCFLAAAIFGTPVRGWLIIAGIVGLALMSFVMLYEAIDPEKPEKSPFKLDLFEKED